MSPSGKAPDFDSGIRRFESCHLCHGKVANRQTRQSVKLFLRSSGLDTHLSHQSLCVAKNKRSYLNIVYCNGVIMKKHKYFRSLDYKNKLESDYKKQRGRYSSYYIYFMTKELDPRYLRENFLSLVPRYNNISRVVDLYSRSSTNMLIYWKKPEVEYSICKVINKKRSRVSFEKKYANRRFRRKLNNLDDDLPSGGDYKKIINGW